MTEAVKSWICSILGAALVLGILEAAAPKGPVRSVARLAAGLVLVVVVFAPLAEWMPGWITGAVREELESVTAFSPELEETDKSYLETIMSQRAAEYIVSQAQALGVSLEASVTCSWTEEGLPVPAAAALRGEVSGETRQVLNEIIQEDLGIPAEQITYEEVAP